MESAPLDNELEVQFYFVSPLFRQLGYHEEQEAPGFHFITRGFDGFSKPKLAVADLIYFADADKSITDGQPLILVECKARGKGHALEFAPKALRSLRKLDRPVIERIKAATDSLREDPRPAGACGRFTCQACSPLAWWWPGIAR